MADEPRKKAKRRRARGDGAVFPSKSKNCWVWRAITGRKPDGSASYTEGRARTQAEALAAKKNAETSARTPDARRETVGDHLDHWLDDVAKPNTRDNTWHRYESVVRLHLKPRVGGVRLRELTVPAVTRLWAGMSRDGMSAGNIKTCSEVLASALEVAVSEGKLPTAPTRGAVKPQVVRKPIEVFTDAEVGKILGAAAGDRFEALFILAVATGAREGELLALEDTDLDRPAALLRITKMLDQTKGVFKIQPPKSASGVRSVSLPAFAVAAVVKHLAGREPGPLFTTRTGGYYSKSNLSNRDWTNLLARAGVPYRKFHTLRHTHASRLLAAGVDPGEVAKRIGDRIETVTRTYAHWMHDPRRDTAGKIEAIYGPKPAGARAPNENRPGGEPGAA